VGRSSQLLRSSVHSSLMLPSKRLCFERHWRRRKRVRGLGARSRDEETSSDDTTEDDQVARTAPERHDVNVSCGKVTS
jgi:hypothetical protein